MKSLPQLALLAFASSVVLLNVNCQPKPAKVNIDVLEKEVAAIVPSSAMTKADVKKICALYLKLDIVKCTGFNEPKDAGEEWTVDPILGNQFKTTGNNLIHIKKATGGLTWVDGPSFPDLSTLVSESKAQIREAH